MITTRCHLSKAKIMRQAKTILIAVSLIGSSLFVHANNEKVPPAEPIIQGSVVNAATKKPLKGVCVKIQSASGENLVESDASGNFKIPAVKGDVVIVLEKKGFKTFRSKKMTITGGVLNKLNFEINSHVDDSEIFHPLSRMMSTW